jgi:hypothetical protein
MSDTFNNYMALIQNRQQQQDKDLGRVDYAVRGLGQAAAGAVQQAQTQQQANRPLNPNLSKFLNLMLSKKLTASQAAKAYQAAKAGHISWDAFDHDPSMPGIQGPEAGGLGGYVGGAAPGMPGAPGGPNGPAGPVNQQYTPEDEGGLAAPEQFIVNTPEAIPSNHQWTQQEAEDFKGLGGLGSMREYDTPADRQRRIDSLNATRTKIAQDRIASQERIAQGRNETAITNTNTRESGANARATQQAQARKDALEVKVRALDARIKNWETTQGKKLDAADAEKVQALQAMIRSAKDDPARQDQLAGQLDAFLKSIEGKNTAAKDAKARAKAALGLK